MKIGDIGEIKAIAFDIDGTLYCNMDFYSKVVFYYAKNFSLFKKFNSVRKELHSFSEPIENFQDVQAQKLAEKLNCSKEEAQNKLNDIAYDGLKKYFVRLKPCNGVVDFIKNIKVKGLKVGILSDFPPEQKGELWGLIPYCDAILGTEKIGILKPAEYSFQILAKQLGVKPEEILYVGNSIKYDVLGSKNAGMKSAWFVPAILGIFGKKSKDADISFWSYKKLNKQLFKD